jgi:clavulanate-9-aldehyde reductase
MPRAIVKGESSLSDTRVWDLSERVVAITGASSGIGHATAVACAGAGAAVAVGARRAERLEELVDQIEAAGGRAVALPADVADEAQAHRFIACAHERLGRLDAVVNNAGLMLLGPIETTDSADWRRMIEVNVLGVLYTTQAAVRIMRSSGQGHIVNVSSIAARRTRPSMGVYSLTKTGINAFSEALRMEVAAHGIRVTVIEPGAVESELIEQNAPTVRDQIIARQAQTHTPLSADDIARAIVYALSQPANVEVNHMFVRPISSAP